MDAHRFHNRAPARRFWSGDGLQGAAKESGLHGFRFVNRFHVRFFFATTPAR